MKSILIIGAGFLQAFVIQKAKEMGYRTLAIDKNPYAVGFNYADQYSAVDIVDLVACLEYARSNRVDGVITAATDYGVLSAAYIAQQMGLPGLDYEIARVVKNKYKMRDIIYKATGLGVSQYFEISETNQINFISESITFPVMVKPCDGSGSKAVNRVDEFEHLALAVDEARNASRINKALIEEFIFGKEYGVESIVLNNKVYVLAVMGKHMTEPPDYAELGHYIPSGLRIEEKVMDIVQKSIHALGINFGAVNMDVLITEDGSVYIVDIGARMGGNLIGSHLIPVGTGVDYMAALVASAVGDRVNLLPVNSSQTVSTRLLALKPGKIKKLPDFDWIQRQERVEIYHHLFVGETIPQYHNNLDGCGYILASGGSLQQTETRVENAKRLIDEGIERE